MELHLLKVGACRHLECMAARGGRWAMVEFPALCGLIRHPQHGWILYDTGYAEHFFEATQSWPECLYRWTLPVDLPASAQLHSQLSRFGLRPSDIGLVIVSHFHGDHIAGLRDFPNARFIALQEDSRHMRSLESRRWRATLTGHLPGLLPADFYLRLQHAEDCPLRSLPSWLAPFDTGFDLLGDGSLLGVPLPGHSQAQLGLFLPQAQGQPCFLLADACWSLPALREGRLPAWPTQFIQAHPSRYAKTFRALSALSQREPAIALLPSHCLHAWEERQHTL